MAKIGVPGQMIWQNILSSYLVNFASHSKLREIYPYLSLYRYDVKTESENIIILTT